MPPVTLHSPAEGLAAGDTYTGPREDWLVQNGYASAGSADFDGLHATSTGADADPTLAANREKAGDEIPAPPEGTKIVDDGTGGRARDVLPNVPLDADPEGVEGQQVKTEGTLTGERAPNVPDVELGAVYQAVVDTRANAVQDDEIVARQEAGKETAPEVLADEAAAAAALEDGTTRIPVSAQPTTTAAPAEATSGAYDPAAHTVDDVTAYLATATDEEKARVLQLEQDGKARTGILG